MLSSTWTISREVNRNHNQRKNLVLGDDVVFFRLGPFSCPTVPDINNPSTKKDIKNPETKTKKRLTV